MVDPRPLMSRTKRQAMAADWTNCRSGPVGGGRPEAMRGVDRATESGILVRHIHLIHGGDSPNETSNVSSPDIDYRSAGVGCRMLVNRRNTEEEAPACHACKGPH